MLAVGFEGGATLPKGDAIGALILICVFIAGGLPSRLHNSHLNPLLLPCWQSMGAACRAAALCSGAGMEQASRPAPCMAPTAACPEEARLPHLPLPGCLPAGFAWSWGPIVWLLGAEIQTLDTRTSGMSAGGLGRAGRAVLRVCS